MFSKFSEESQKILLNAKKEMVDLKHPYVGSEHLLLSILKNTNLELTNKLNEYNINYEIFKKEIIKVIGRGSISNEWFLYTPLLKRIIEGAAINCKEQKEKEVSPLHLFLSMMEEGDGVAIRLLIGMNIDIDELYNEFSSNISTIKSCNSKKLLIEEFSVDLNKKAANKELDPVIGRDEEVNSIIEVLSRRSKNNPLLIGPAGVGKTAIVEELANRIINDNVPKNLKNKRILSVAMSSLVAGTKYRGEFEERINKLLKEVEENENIILFIDEIHTLVGAGGAEGAIDASNILKPSLARGKIKIIGATTTEEYTKYLEKDKALDRRFQKINIKEPTKEKTKEILLNIKSLYESFHNTKITNEIIDYIVDVSDKYIHNRKFPDKAIDILDEVCAKTVLTKDKRELKIEKFNQELNIIKKAKKEAIIKENYDLATQLKNDQCKLETSINKIYLKDSKNKVKEITKEMVIDTIYKKTSIPIFNNLKINNKIKNLELYLNKKVKGQCEVIKNLSDYTKKKQLGFADNKVHSFLYVGKTGVGKTLLVKEYAKYIYSEQNFIRLDMSEYKESHTISKIIGSPPGYVGYDDNNYLLEKVRNNPYCVVLLDEIEKASNNVLKLFLQILDEGKIKDSKGNDVYFDNCIIFMTSNFGCNENNIGFNDSKNTSLLNKLNDYFGVELINRIDDILVFNNLDKSIAKSIVKDKLNKLKKYYRLQNVNLSYNNRLLDKICDDSNIDIYGARRIEKIIDKIINSYIINEIINGNNEIKILETI